MPRPFVEGRLCVHESSLLNLSPRVVSSLPYSETTSRAGVRMGPRKYRLVFASGRRRVPLFTEVALRPPSVAVKCAVTSEHHTCHWTTHSAGCWQSELESCNSSDGHHRRRLPPAASEGSNAKLPS